MQSLKVLSVLRPGTVQLEVLEQSMATIASEHDGESPFYYALSNTSQGELILLGAKANIAQRGGELEAEKEEASFRGLLQSLPTEMPKEGVVDLVYWQEWGAQAAAAATLWKRLTGNSSKLHTTRRVVVKGMLPEVGKILTEGVKRFAANMFLKSLDNYKDSVDAPMENSSSLGHQQDIMVPDLCNS